MIIVYPVGHTDLLPALDVNGRPTWSRWKEAGVLADERPGKERVSAYWLGEHLQGLEPERLEMVFGEDDGRSPRLRAVRLDALRARWPERMKQATLVLLGTEVLPGEHEETATEALLPILRRRAQPHFKSVKSRSVPGNAALVDEMLAGCLTVLGSLLERVEEVDVVRAGGTYALSLGAMLAATSLQARWEREVGAIAISEPRDRRAPPIVTRLDRSAALGALRNLIARELLGELVATLKRHRAYDLIATLVSGSPRTRLIDAAAIDAGDRRDAARHARRLAVRALALRREDVDRASALFAAFGALELIDSRHRTEPQQTLAQQRHAHAHWQPSGSPPPALPPDLATWEAALGAWAGDDDAARLAEDALKHWEPTPIEGELTGHVVMGPGLADRHTVETLWRTAAAELGQAPQALVVHSTRSPAGTPHHLAAGDTGTRAEALRPQLAAWLGVPVRVSTLTANFSRRDEVRNLLSTRLQAPGRIVVIDAGGLPVLRETLVSLALERDADLLVVRSIAGGGGEVARIGERIRELLEGEVLRRSVGELVRHGEPGMLARLLPASAAPVRFALLAEDLAAGRPVAAAQVRANTSGGGPAKGILATLVAELGAARWRGTRARADLLAAATAHLLGFDGARSASRAAIAARLALLEGYRIAAVERIVGGEEPLRELLLAPETARFFEQHVHAAQRCGPVARLSEWRPASLDNDCSRQILSCATRSDCKHGCPLAGRLSHPALAGVGAVAVWLENRHSQLRPLHGAVHYSGPSPAAEIDAVGLELLRKDRADSLRRGLKRAGAPWAREAARELARPTRTLPGALAVLRTCFGLDAEASGLPSGAWTTLLGHVEQLALQSEQGPASATVRTQGSQ